MTDTLMFSGVAAVVLPTLRWYRIFLEKMGAHGQRIRAYSLVGLQTFNYTALQPDTSGAHSRSYLEQ